MKGWRILLLGGLLASVAIGACEAYDRVAWVQGTGKPPEFFIDGMKKPALLAMIRKNMDSKINFNGHFSMAIVPCGSPCIGFWFVDRKTGGVAEVPDGKVPFEIITDVDARPDSDVISVVYSSLDGTTCTSQHFHWAGKVFIAVDPRRSKRCE